MFDLQNPTGKELTWTWPVLIVFARLVFAVLAQSFVAGLFAVSGHPDPWQAAAPWLPVYGSLIDVGCLLLLTFLVRREGIRVRDLIGFDRQRLGRDLLSGALLFVLFTALAIGGIVLAGLAIYGSAGPPPPFGALPLWAALYSVFIWPLLWAITEETTYLGYGLPRLAALSGRSWVAISIMAIGVAAQHIALPLGDSAWMLYRFSSFLPLAIVLGIVFLRTRRLMPFIIAHWAADAYGTATGVLLPLVQQ
ncbi:MAG: CPBP family intramembrane metalloprotease [bacterium]|nr:CPBP family intramembrane metalloprotease [bacterium]